MSSRLVFHGVRCITPVIKSGHTVGMENCVQSREQFCCGLLLPFANISIFAVQTYTDMYMNDMPVSDGVPRIVG